MAHLRHYTTKEKTWCIVFNDAKSCYDRIVHSVASLAMQRVGAPVEPIICMFTSIQHLQHRIRTVFGDSEVGSVVHCMWFRFKVWVKEMGPDLRFGQW